MSNLINKAKDMLSRDKNDNNDNYGQSGGQSGSINPGDNYASGNQGFGDNQRSDNFGPHSSNLANKADPRVDSNQGGYGQQDTYGGSSGNTGIGSGGNTGISSGNQGYGDNPRSDNFGPHSSNLANRADPRVDSNQGGYGQSGIGAGTTGDQTQFGSGAATGGEHHHHHHHHQDQQQSNVGGGYDQGVGGTTGGYQDSGLSSGGLNDPTTGGRTGGGFNDSSLGGRTGGDNFGDSNLGGRTGGGFNDSSLGGRTGGDNFGDSGVGGRTGDNFGSSGVGGRTGGGFNDSGMGGDNFNQQATTGGQYGGDQYGSSNTGGGQYGDDNYGSSATPGSGNAQKTAGPHNSNLLNKLDPRVDSDMDGSKTMGGNKTNY